MLCVGWGGGGWSPADLISVLLLDAYPFDCFITEDDGEAVEGGHDYAGRQSFGERSEAFLLPQDLERLPY